MKMKEYRQNVAAIILNKENKIWLGKRADGMNWGFPQGGIEAGEKSETAIIRELSEEIGTKEFEIIGQYPGTLKYDFPKEMKFPTWTYAGQEQHYFLVRLHEEAKINLESHPEEIEFSTYQFLGLSEIRKMDFGFKNDVYHQALDYFSKIIEKN
ncbi:RNA pyrophosphohydrolase [Lactococcus lactis]|nr:RNA pyrophosphohydrolase [Lactococcus lactis]